MILKPVVIISKIALKLKATRFDKLSRHARGASTMIVAMYHPCSQPISNAFYSKFTTLLELFATFLSPTIITGDINVHLEKPDDVDSRKL